MNEKPKSTWPLKSGLIIIIVSVCAAATFYWTTPYADIDKASPNGWFGAAFLAGIVCGAFTERYFAKTGLLVTAGFMLAVIIRVIYDISFVDKTSHNLFPFEVVIWTIMAGIPAIAGTFIGSMLNRMIVKVSKNSNKA